uniref:FMRFamide receptor n=1 Tax=Cacopsylla melanoneura TaxID=428564 RepID=A0A8D8YKQ9_9HEMI
MLPCWDFDQPDDPYFRFRESARFWTQRILLPIVFVIGLIGNLVTVVVLTRRRMKSSTNTYLTALAVSDIVYLSVFFALSYSHYPDAHSEDSLIYWKIWPYLLWFNDASTGVSVWLTASFTLERYIAVCHPLRGRVFCTESRAQKVITCVVLFCAIVTVTTPLEWQILTVDRPENVTTGPDSCIIADSSELATNEFYKTFMYFFWNSVFIFIPLVILIVFNSFLIHTVHVSRKQRNGLTQAELGGGSMRQKQENKITMTLIGVVIFFLVCQLPAGITWIVKVFYDPPPNTSGHYLLLGFGNIFNFLVTVNAASNFILYCALSDKYRKTLIMTFFPCCVKPVDTNTTLTTYASFRHSTKYRVPSLKENGFKDKVQL